MSKCDYCGNENDCRTCGLTYDDGGTSCLMKCKEHPIVTNGDKFKEVFGFEIMKTPNGCAGLSCHANCDTCLSKGFWNKEYKGVEG